MKQRSKTVSLLAGMFKKSWALLLGLVCAIVLSAVLSSVTPVLFQKVIDNLSALDTLTLILYVAAIVALPFLVTLLDVGKTRLSFTFTNNAAKQLRMEVYEQLLNVKMGAFSTNSVQGFLYSVTRSVGKICDVFLGGDVLNFIANTVQILTAFAFLVMLDWAVAIGCMVVMPLLFLVIKSQRSRVDRKEAALHAVMREGEGMISETLKNMKAVRMFGGKEYERGRFLGWNDRNIKAGWGVRFTHALAVKILPNSVEQMMYGVVFILCILAVARGSMTAGTLVAILSYVPLFYRSMSGLLSVQIGMSAVAKPIEELDEIFAMERETGTEPLTLTDGQLYSDTAMLRFSNVFFTYGRVPCNVAIDELAIQKGEFIVIVGESGGGKTTLFDLACRFFDPIEGEIYFLGRNIRAVEPDELRKYIALMPQEALLWNDTMAYNIDYPQKGTDGAKLDSVIHDAALGELAHRLDGAENKRVGEDGRNISGGERQRISVARALNKEALLYLFDEPTSLMDSITAEQVFKRIAAIRSHKKTVLMVTHNLSHAAHADKVLVFRDGKVEGFDTYENLLASCPYFASLVNSFSSNGVAGRG